MNNLLDFAGLLLYYIVLPLLIPVQALLYAFAGLWMTLLFCHRLLLSIPRLLHWTRMATRNSVGGAQLHNLRKKLVKIPA